MNGHWCEGLDWIRAEDIIEADPDVYVRLLANLLGQFSFAAEGQSDTKKLVVLHAEIERRVRGGLLCDDQRGCILDAMQLRADDDARRLAALKKILARPNFSIVK